MPRSLRIVTFNAENFSLLVDPGLSRKALDALPESEYQAMNASIFYPNKDRDKISSIALMIQKGRFDVVGLCEVGGLQTLTTFNRLYLKDAYDVFLDEENSRRGIYVGALVRKGRFPHIKATNRAGSFARNLLQLDLGPEADNLRIYIVHLKSQFGRDWGIEHRLKEVDLLTTAVRPINCIVMGDFNGILIPGEAQFEYQRFLDLPLRDVLETIGVPRDSRRTHYHFDPEPRFTQLDYLFCSEDWEVAKAGVIEGLIPLNREQRRQLPSDHLPLWAEVRRPRRSWRHQFAQFFQQGRPHE